jgi:predicted nucleic acid-binding protein
MPGGSGDVIGAVLLDTTVLIDALRGKAAAVHICALKRAGDVPYACAVNVEEVMRGLHPGEERTAARMLDALRIAPLGRRQGEMAGRWRRSFAAKGVTLRQADCLVAAAAVGIGARLATGNPKDFPMRETPVDHWPAGA